MDASQGTSPTPGSDPKLNQAAGAGVSANPAQEATLSPGEGGPLTPQQRTQYANAVDDMKALSGAQRLAAFNGWTFAIIGGCSIPFAWGDVWSMLIAVTLLGLGIAELYGKEMLRKLNPSGGKLLAICELVLLAMILSYCGWKLHTGIDQQSISDPDVRQIYQQYQGVVENMATAVYSIVAAVSVIYQGLGAVYFLRTARRMRQWLDTTPSWVFELLQTRPKR